MTLRKPPKKFRILLSLLAAGLATVSLLPYVGASTHDASTPALLVEFFAHFRAQYAAIGLLLVGAAVLVRARPALLMAIFATAINLAHLAPYYLFSEPEAGRDPTRLRVLHANVERGNRNYAGLLALVRARDPDLIFLQEYDEPWFRAVHAELAAYPYRKYRLGAYFGIGVYSRVKPESIEFIQAGRARVPSLHLRMRGPRGIHHLVSSHPPPPIGLRNTRNRNHQLEELATYVRALQGPVFLSGDLNVSPWSPAFRRFLRKSGLREIRGYGSAPTWPTRLPWFVNIPIDHCLLRGAVFMNHFEVPPGTGSDHRPLLCEIGFAD